MFRNYCKAAVRNLWKNKIFSAINITGLTVGLTSFMLIALYIFDEMTYDRSHQNSENIYRVVENNTSAGGEMTRRAGTGAQVSIRAKADFPEVKDVARISTYWRAEIKTGDHKAKVFHEYFIAANPGFLNVFSFPLVEGDRASALTEPKTVILTEEMAKKLFGSLQVLGKLLFFDNDSVPYKVTGVLKDFPVNSSLSYPMLVSESSITSNKGAKGWIESDWNSGAFSTYFLLDQHANVQALDSKLDHLIADNHASDPGSKTQVQLQALKDIHFYSNDIEGNSGKKGNIAYIYVFLLVGCFILVIACINYMNLSTARFTNRGKEIAIRKVAGASRTTLVNQFLTEALLATVLSAVLSLTLVNILLPAFNAFSGKSLSINLHTDYRVWAGVGLTLVIVTLLAGLYPAFFQSGLNPLALLKSRLQLGRSNISLRRSLVVFQFMISIVLIAATMIIYQQMRYVDHKDMGFDKNKLVVIDVDPGYARRAAATIKDEFSKLAQVRSVCVSSRVPGEWKTIPSVKVVKGKGDRAGAKDMYFFATDGQFLSTYEVKLLKGRNFFAHGSGDSTSVLINETAARSLGIGDVAGQQITIPATNSGGDNRSALDRPFTATIVGIVKDFNFQSLHEPLAPMVLGYQRNPVAEINYFTVKLGNGDVGGTLKRMDGIIRSYEPNNLFEYHFLDKQWDLLYRQDKISQTIFLAVSLLAIFIAALGLLGLTIYAAEQRIKEIGVRKVLGAGVGSIVVMLSKDFLKLVVVAAVIAVPVGWMFMRSWLENFAYRIEISGWVFLAAALAAIVIAVATISFQVLRAARANPVESLRGE